MIFEALSITMNPVESNVNLIPKLTAGVKYKK